MTVAFGLTLECAIHKSQDGSLRLVHLFSAVTPPRNPPLLCAHRDGHQAGEGPTGMGVSILSFLRDSKPSGL